MKEKIRKVIIKYKRLLDTIESLDETKKLLQSMQKELKELEEGL